MSNIDSPNPKPLQPLREVIREYRLSTKQSLGQNFILDQQLTDKIVKVAALSHGVHAIEIGPGPGGLTRSILSASAVKSFHAIEMDQRCYPLLEHLFTHFDQPCELIKGDALTVEIEHLGNAPRAVLANLPYNVSTVILIKLLEKITAFESLTLMFQKEVAQRIVASPGTKTYGRLSVMAQWVCEIKHCFDISPQAFVPPPKVVSSVVRFAPKKDLDARMIDQYWGVMSRVVGAAFQQRRKMLRQSLKAIFGQDVEDCLQSVNIAPTERAENLSVQQFFQIAKTLLV